MAKQYGTNIMSTAVNEYLESKYPGITKDTAGYSLVHKTDGTNILTLNLYVSGAEVGNQVEIKVVADTDEAMTNHIRTLGAQGKIQRINVDGVKYVQVEPE